MFFETEAESFSFRDRFLIISEHVACWVGLTSGYPLNTSWKNLKNISIHQLLFVSNPGVWSGS